VVACNTASSYALEVLKGSLPIPVFGVIEPGVKRALENTKGKVGVIGTKATISSCAYKNLLEINGVEVHQRACPLFVPLVEEGLLEGSLSTCNDGRLCWAVFGKRTSCKAKGLYGLPRP